MLDNIKEQKLVLVHKILYIDDVVVVNEEICNVVEIKARIDKPVATVCMVNVYGTEIDIKSDKLQKMRPDIRKEAVPFLRDYLEGICCNASSRLKQNGLDDTVAYMEDRLRDTYKFINRFPINATEDIIHRGDESVILPKKIMEYILREAAEVMESVIKELKREMWMIE